MTSSTAGSGRSSPEAWPVWASFPPLNELRCHAGRIDEVPETNLERVGAEGLEPPTPSL